MQKLEEAPKEWKEFDKKRKEIEKEYGKDNVFLYINIISKALSLAKSDKKYSAYELYELTAGEIEARDAASRKNLTEAERKNTRPDIDRKDVVFAENSGVGYSFRGYNADEIEVYETSEDIKNLPWTDKIKKFTDLINNDYAGRTARFKRNGHIFYAEFDKDFAKKTLYGEKHFSSKGKKAFVRAVADGDIFDLVENASYTASAKDIK